MNKKKDSLIPTFKTLEERAIATVIVQELRELKLLAARNDLNFEELSRIMVLRNRYHGHYSKNSTRVWDRVLYRVDQFRPVKPAPPTIQAIRK